MSPCRPSARRSRARRAGTVGGGEPDGVEAERLGLFGDGLFQRLCHLAPSFRRKPESRSTCSEFWILDTGFRLQTNCETSKIEVGIGPCRGEARDAILQQRPDDGRDLSSAGRGEALERVCDAQQQELLRRFSINDEAVLMDAMATCSPPEGLDRELSALSRIAASSRATRPSRRSQWAIDDAMANGAIEAEIVGSRCTRSAPIVDSPRVAPAAPGLALALGYDVEQALES